ncbi:hypothetical protein CHCC14820_4019 [Bacillus paralicheniformis]|uniref:Uncharacterized protein n=1 Tax=Bacillus paralicheniformis TaxID=1648923 RepID=A0A7Z0WU94_9BACI|nr:hypothetical protein SC10_B2orf02967 [Bacillus paralicheniformis]OLF87834.1 hypothetical protein B4121_4286 [Bacillus paralicheniformis]OLG07330.1 hypothetical protein B4125_1511 [Bacillus paralicheniformis]TWJ51514.1 hypothetical protein CHCC5022_1378 [Bacillus paralicheniformis]TWJ70098.1 hypothetical protein CHCC4186_3815 [Bacillus paralicheniformis]
MTNPTDTACFIHSFLRAASLKNTTGAQAKTAGQNTVMLVRFHFIIGGIFL